MWIFYKNNVKFKIIYYNNKFDNYFNKKKDYFTYKSKSIYIYTSINEWYNLEIKNNIN
jgi:hypothetical protein